VHSDAAVAHPERLGELVEVIEGHPKAAVVLLPFEAQLAFDLGILGPLGAFVTPVALPFALAPPRVADLQQLRAVLFTHVQDALRVPSDQTLAFLTPVGAHQRADLVLLEQRGEHHFLRQSVHIHDVQLAFALLGFLAKHVVDFDSVVARVKILTLVASQGSDAPYSHASLEFVVIPAEFCERLLEQHHPDFVGVRGGELGVACALLAGNLVIHRYPYPLAFGPFLLVEEADVLRAVGVVFGLLDQPLDHGGLLRYTRDRSHQPTVPQSALEDVSRLDFVQLETRTFVFEMIKFPHADPSSLTQ